ncbi:MAG: hypothetical protein KDD65_12465 [Bacteroidetes bacterium]|nr:hypothetical protein [Bacteroidota bacterium]
MTGRQRRGMVIKNTNATPVSVQMTTRAILLRPGDEEMVTAEEVQDAGLRDHLQVRSVSIVRPTTEEEEIQLKERLDAIVPNES